MSSTSKSGMRDRSQLVLLHWALSIYTGTFHLALLRYQRCHSQMYHLDIGLLRLLCYRILREDVCCNYDLPVKNEQCLFSPASVHPCQKRLKLACVTEAASPPALLHCCTQNKVL